MSSGIDVLDPSLASESVQGKAPPNDVLHVPPPPAFIPHVPVAPEQLFPPLPTLPPSALENLPLDTKFSKAAAGLAFTMLHERSKMADQKGSFLLQAADNIRETVTGIHNNTQTQIAELFHRVGTLEYENAQLRKQAKNDAGLEADDGEEGLFSDSESEAEEEADEKKVKIDSDTAIKHPFVQKVVVAIFQKFLGASKLSKEELIPSFPDDYDRTTLPFIAGSKDIHQLRLDWSKGPKEHPNDKAIEDMVAFAKSHGGDYVADSRELLEMCGISELEQKFRKKFDALRRIKNADPETGNSKSRTKSNNRAAGKLAVRRRKREQLPEDSEYRHERYDTAFELQIMSEDEDEVVEGKASTIRYISRPPTYRSSRLQELFDAVDAMDDPAPARGYLQRVRGDPVEVQLPKTKTFTGRHRYWMVDAAWLAANPKSGSRDRLANDGPLWDPAEPDPEATQKLSKDTVAEKAAKKAGKRRAGTDDQDGDGDGSKKSKKQKKAGKKGGKA